MNGSPVGIPTSVPSQRRPFGFVDPSSNLIVPVLGRGNDSCYIVLSIWPAPVNSPTPNVRAL